MFLSVASLCVLMAGSSVSQSIQSPIPLTANGVIAKAVARSRQTNAQAQSGEFTYTKVSVTEEFDGAGRMREHKEKVYQVSFHGGESFAKLLEVNGRAPAEADLKKQTENEMNLHQILGDSKSAKGDNRESFLTAAVAARFDFSLGRQTLLNGRSTYVVDFQPRNPPPPVHRLVDKLLDRLSGQLWIDAEEFEIARADVRLRSEVDLLGGVVGCLRKLAYTMTRTRVADGVWLNSYSSGDFEGRKLLDSLHIKTHTESSNFRPLT